jgi:hypothetical protein
MDESFFKDDTQSFTSLQNSVDGKKIQFFVGKKNF